MSFGFGSTTPAQSTIGFGSTPAKTGFGTGFSFGATPATTASTGFGTPFGGTSFGTPASTAATGFGTTFGTPATSTATGIGTAFGTPASTSSTGFGTSFGTPATSASTGFGTFSSFGTPTPAATTSNLFSGFGGATTTAATGFTGFGAGTSLNTGFGTGTTGAFGASTGFGTGTTGAFGTSTGFGTGTTGAFGTSTGFGAGPSTGFSGFGTNTAPSFSGFGSSFGAKPITSTGFGGFGNTLSNTTLGQLQPQQQQAPVDPNQAIYNSIFNCNIFGDERDTILAKWNLVQASWGTGKGYYSMTVPPVEYTQQNPYCRFKAIGYSVIPGHDNKEGLAAIIFNKKEIEVKAQKDQLLTSLSTIMGNKPNLIVSIHDIRAISDSKTQVLICVQEKGMTGSVRKIPANDLANFLLQPMQKQQLGSLGTENVFAHVMPDSDQLKEYLSKAPTGVDIRIWKQAQLDNPNPEKYIPVPLIGFEQLKWRSKCQEKETGLHRGFMEQVSRDVIELKRRHSASVAQIAEQKRKLLDLQHRVLQILVKQEVTRKAGMALQPEEEVLKGQLENMQTQISVPTQFKGRLNELLAQIRMQTQNGKISTAERYNMEPGVQEDIKQFLRMEQNGINHLVEIINTDMAHLKTIRDGMQDLIQRH